MAELLVDTDVLVDHLRGHRPFSIDGDRVHHSVITRAELMAGRSADEEPIRRLLAPFTEVDVDRSIAESGGRLRRERSIALSDPLIAATALRDKLILVTRNEADFKAIPGVRLRRPA